MMWGKSKLAPSAVAPVILVILQVACAASAFAHSSLLLM